MRAAPPRPYASSRPGRLDRLVPAVRRGSRAHPSAEAAPDGRYGTHRNATHHRIGSADRCSGRGLRRRGTGRRHRRAASTRATADRHHAASTRASVHRCHHAASTRGRDARRWIAASTRGQGPRSIAASTRGRDARRSHGADGRRANVRGPGRIHRVPGGLRGTEVRRRGRNDSRPNDARPNWSRRRGCYARCRHPIPNGRGMRRHRHGVDRRGLHRSGWDGTRLRRSADGQCLRGRHGYGRRRRCATDGIRRLSAVRDRPDLRHGRSDTRRPRAGAGSGPSRHDPVGTRRRRDSIGRAAGAAVARSGRSRLPVCRSRLLLSSRRVEPSLCFVLLLTPLTRNGHPSLGGHLTKKSGGVLLSHRVPPAVPSAQRVLASGFGM